MPDLWARLEAGGGGIVMEQERLVNVVPFPLKVFEIPDLIFKQKEPFNDIVEEYFQALLNIKRSGEVC